MGDVLRYKTIYDKPGRLRIRWGQHAFSKAQGRGLEKMLVTHPWIHSAQASHVNGGLLIHYEKPERDKLLEFLGGLKVKEINPLNEDNAIDELDENFIRSFSIALGKLLFTRIFLPPPIRVVLTLKNALYFWKRGFTALGQGKLNVDVLDATAITASICKRDFATAASIMALLRITDLLEEYTRKKANATLSQSLILNIDNVWAVTADGDVLMPLSRIAIGDIIRVRMGGIIPLDGEVEEGTALVNESSMTGEPLAALRKPGHSVYAGTIVEEGSMTIKVKTLADNTRIQNIVSMINQSEALKAGIQSKAEKLADTIVPFSFIASALTFLFTGSIAKATSVLMVDYSCAIKLTTPICIISAMREAANRKILVKGGKHLEAFALADTIVFDKTGTLTVASPEVEKVVAFDGFNPDEVLKISACLEEHFPHSVAKAIVRQAEKENLHHAEEHADVEYIVAHGISSILNGEKVLIGSEHFIFDDEGIPLSDTEKAIIEKESDGYSVIYLAAGGKAAGMICVNDPVRTEAKAVLDTLRKLGMKRIIMLTGDGEAAARRVCETLGIDEYHSQVLPESKAEILRSLRGSGHTVVMVGDGINDSPALSCADVSVAMKDGADIAKEVADITLLSETLDGLVELRILSNQLLNRIRVNYRAILGFNTLLLLLGIGGAITPPASAVLHNLSTLALSGLSVRRYE
ncbi:MAG: heavy metal translocating P-type ATPase [Defluviitaleaceae bacterium]|nr:heavy metal translocating P-type ATPase [Defluviitaleaceae bacterium]